MDDSDSDIRCCGQSLLRASVGTRISSRVGAVLKMRMAYAKGIIGRQRTDRADLANQRASVLTVPRFSRNRHEHSPEAAPLP